MLGKEIAALLQKSLPVLPQIICGPTLRHDIDELAAGALPDLRLAVIDDRNTGEALGDAVFRALKTRCRALHVTLETTAATLDAVEYVRSKTAECGALVAVGSGTINDVCKYASFLEGKPFIVFPTAASMNGYLSANASIAVDGYKKTMAAHMPAAVFCDLSVLAAAPARLSRSGLGDSLARSTAQADWLLSHLTLNTSYSDVPFALLKELEPHLLESAGGIARGDPESIELLMRILLLSGLGMTIAHGSYPASQAEHMIAHGYGMLVPPPPSVTLHGEEVGVTTLTMARLQETLLRASPALAATDFPTAALETLFGEKVTAEAKKAYAIKRERIQQSHSWRWEDITQRIEPIMVPSDTIRAALKAAGAPYTPEMLGWEGKTYEAVLAHARFLRDRFTFLDLQE